MTTRAVVVMGKLPRPGRVKTRMCPPLTPERAAHLYGAFLADVFVYVDGETNERRVFSCALVEGDTVDEARALAPAGWNVVAQSGEGLGARIEDARTRGAADHVLVLGSDAPTMAPGRIRAAFAALAEHDAVFGPTEDGGYDLVGFAGPQPALLRDIPWSTSEVMAATERAAAGADLKIVKLSVGYDVDRAEDLERALADAKRLERVHTRRAIEATLASQTTDD